MNPQTLMLVIIISLLGYPIGLLIAKFTEEELQAGKRWFKLLVVAMGTAIVVSILFARGETLLFLIASFMFILLIALASLIYPRARLTSSRAKKKAKKKKQNVISDRPRS